MSLVAVPRVSHWLSGTQGRSVLIVHSHQFRGDISVQGRNHILVLGLGYSGTALANYIAHTRPEWSVTGTTRCNTADGLRYPIHDSVRVLEDVHFGQDSVCDWDTMDCGMTTHIVSTIPPARVGNSPDPVLESIMQHKSTAFPSVEWTGYVSTTSIYGNHDGCPVWEESEIKETGSPRYAAEQQWVQCLGAHIFRCGGIYGPYRSVMNSIRASLIEEKELSNTQKARQGRAVTFRCHVYDVCQSIEHSIERPRPGAIYNIVDDDPSSRRDVEKYAYNKYFGIESPHRNEPLLPPEKMVMNTRMKDELQVILQYPNYKQGLDALELHNDLRPFTF